MYERAVRFFSSLHLHFTFTLTTNSNTDMQVLLLDAYQGSTARPDRPNPHSARSSPDFDLCSVSTSMPVTRQSPPHSNESSTHSQRARNARAHDQFTVNYILKDAPLFYQAQPSALRKQDLRWSSGHDFRLSLATRTSAGDRGSIPRRRVIQGAFFAT